MRKPLLRMPGVHLLCLMSQLKLLYLINHHLIQTPRANASNFYKFYKTGLFDLNYGTAVREILAK